MSEQNTENWVGTGIEAIAEEVAFYKAHLAEWAVDHEGEFVLVKGSAQHGFFPTQDDALCEGYRRFGRVPMVVKKVDPNEKPVVL